MHVISANTTAML